MTDNAAPPIWVVPLCVGSVLALYLVYLTFVSPPTLDVTADGILEVQHLLLWSSAGVVLHSMMFWCLGVGLIVLRRYSKDRPPGERRVVYGLLAGPTLVTAVLALNNPAAGFGGGQASEVILRGLFSAYPVVKWILVGTNILGALVLATLIQGSVLVTRDLEQHDPKDLGERSRSFRTLLYSAGVLLGAVLYEVFRLYDWAASAAGTTVSPKGLASSLTFATGLIFSTLMAAIFLPSAMQLERQEEAMVIEASRRNPTFERDRWAVSNGIPGSPLTALGSYVAVLIPMITGILTKLLETWVSP